MIKIKNYSLALVETNVDRALELHVGRVGELEGAELGAQNVTVRGVEVLEQERIHGTTEISFLSI